MTTADVLRGLWHPKAVTYFPPDRIFLRRAISPNRTVTSISTTSGDGSMKNVSRDASRCVSSTTGAIGRWWYKTDWCVRRINGSPSITMAWGVWQHRNSSPIPHRRRRHAKHCKCHSIRILIRNFILRPHRRSWHSMSMTGIRRRCPRLWLLKRFPTWPAIWRVSSPKHCSILRRRGFRPMKSWLRLRIPQSAENITVLTTTTIKGVRSSVWNATSRAIFSARPADTIWSEICWRNAKAIPTAERPTCSTAPSNTIRATVWRKRPRSSMTESRPWSPIPTTISDSLPARLMVREHTPSTRRWITICRGGSLRSPANCLRCGCVITIPNHIWAIAPPTLEISLHGGGNIGLSTTITTVKIASMPLLTTTWHALSTRSSISMIRTVHRTNLWKMASPMTKTAILLRWTDRVCRRMI